MCGFAGCVLPPGQSPDRAVLERMARAIEHRGPDAHGVAIAGSAGLCHARLSIVDPSPSGAQPMTDGSGRWLLSYNGEVFNHLDLRASLAGVPWRGHSDTETLVEALAAWGEDAVPRCNGLFAYAALDTERRRLLLVRDRFGVKPLYFARHDGGLWFASEIRALLAAGVPRRARRETLAHHVVHGWANGRLTPVEGIDRVLPGTLLAVDLDSLDAEERRWYDPADAVDSERAAGLSRLPREELARQVEDELRASVRRRLMADVPVGTMCSGGIDSSVVTALAREEHPEVIAFNASVADQPHADEGPWAELVAGALGVELRTVGMTAEGWRAGLVEAVLHHEYPLMHESSVPMAQIAGLAREGGVKVLLSGEGADELFGGYGFLHRADYLGYLRANRRLGTVTRLAAGKLRRDGPLGIARSAAGAARRRARARRGIRDSTDPMGKPLGFPGPGASEHAARYEIGLRERAAAAYAYSDPSRRGLEAGLLGDLGTYLPHLLNRQDKNTMQCSIETRVPFLDPAVVSLALNLPLEARVEPRRKGVLRDVARRLLPPEVADRRKVGFGFDVAAYVRPAARPEFLRDGLLREELGVPTGAWREAVGMVAGHDVLRLWTAEIWCRLFLAADGVAGVERALWR
ncbi:MAG: asparagine synthase (glutamine-hydrolyzing) [Thermoleophilaceae bacterium]